MITNIYDAQYPLVAIVAMSTTGVIGDGKKMPWHIPQDLKRVRGLTMGKPLIMGRRTFESIGKPLAGRANIVLTQNETWQKKGVLVAHTPLEAVQLASDWIDADPSHKPEIIIFGGGEIYKLFMPHLARIEATTIDKAYNDIGSKVAFPKNALSDWVEDITARFPAQANTPAFTYATLRPKADLLHEERQASKGIVD
ncbi:MAG: dihydrofolate reductase [Proteobacteria bacterium]|nr:dihydrofolate reductase [Pseudomonadota bacterium]